MWDYLVRDWFRLMPAPWAHVAATLAAVVCGWIVGGERERKEKPAGLRTLVLVCLGSAAFTMVSIAFTTTTGDSGRVAAQIVTGIGFLGAGAILHHRTATITGLTTAASIWVTAATGMVVGAGFPVAGLGLSLLTRAVLTLIFFYEAHQIKALPPSGVELVFDPNHGKARIRIEKIFDEFHVAGELLQATRTAEGHERIRLTFHLPQRQRRDFLHQLASLPEVREIQDVSGTSRQS